MKTREQLERDVNAAIKLVMSEMERLASLPPEEAAEPVAFNECRQRVVRKIWSLYKECLVHGGKDVQR